MEQANRGHSPLTDLSFLTTYSSSNQQKFQSFDTSHLGSRLRDGRFLTIAVATAAPITLSPDGSCSSLL
jgi:hypothetical protein